jgi:hypothetical protein
LPDHEAAAENDLVDRLALAGCFQPAQQLYGRGTIGPS